MEKDSVKSLISSAPMKRFWIRVIIVLQILEVNRQYLQHDYYTDIITFDYCEGDRLSGDLFISLDTIRTNAEQFGAAYDDELHRVIIHGILHLCGINDKGPGEREIMEEAENKALAMR